MGRTFGPGGGECVAGVLLLCASIKQDDLAASQL